MKRLHALSAAALAAQIFMISLSACSTIPTPNGAHDVSDAPRAPLEATLSSKEVKGGSLLVVTAKTRDPLPANAKMTARLGQIDAPFFEVAAGAGMQFEAVLAVPLLQPEGPAQVEVSMEGHPEGSVSVPLEVVSTERRSERIRVGRRFTTPAKRRIASAVLDPSFTREEFYQRITEHKYWNGPFHLPVEDSHVTSPFGTQRTFNGKMKSFHTGVDFHAGIGTHVKAASGGIVVLSRKLFSTGNTVIIDHGYGIFTIYAHLSKRLVRVGTEVSGESLVGYSGKTGRAKGPHLHWGAVVRGIKVDSLGLLDIPG